MERTKRTNIKAPEFETVEKIQWQCVGGGGFYLDKRTIIKPGQKFFATESQISKAFRDIVIKVGVVSEKVVKPIPAVDSKPPVEVKYELLPLPKVDETDENEEQLFQVINYETKKQIGDNGLSKEDAEQLVKDLSE